MKRDLIGLSFIGPTVYKSACYCWNYSEPAFEYTTDLFPEVLSELFSLSSLLLFVTDEAANHENSDRLSKNLGKLLKTVPIPQGKSEEELWDIFSIVAEHVPPKTSLVIDITHAFRSLPLIVFNVASYLKRIKNVSVERIVYGNFEVRDTSFTPPKVPIFDLTPAVDLQDWLHGIDAFQRRGNAEELADSLSRTQDRLYQTSEISTKEAGLPHSLKHTASQLQYLSESLRLLRPIDASFHAAKAHNLLKIVQEEALRWAKPFADVLRDLDVDILPLQNKEPNILDIDNLKAQFALIHYYLKKDLIVQTILLAREWLVNMLIFRTGRHKNWCDRNTRHDSEKELGLVAKVVTRKIISETAVERLPFWYKKDPRAKDIAYMWNTVLQMRNDVAHCAMSTSAASAATIRNNIKNLIPCLETLLNDDT